MSVMMKPSIGRHKRWNQLEGKVATAGSDCRRQLVERLAKSVSCRLIYGDCVMAAPQALHEGMTRGASAPDRYV